MENGQADAAATATTEDVDPAGSLLRSLRGPGYGGEDALLVDAKDDHAGGATDDRADKDVEAARKQTRFDWVAHKKAFPNTPPHAAITAMFAEYALLVGRITRHLGAAVGAPMTLQEREETAAQAQTFVVRYATPTLGPLHTTKVDKLLCHLMQAVRRHGNIMNGDTSDNEQQHKDDKPHYVRINKSAASYVGQLVRHAQGYCALFRRNVMSRARASATATGHSLDGDSDGNAADDDVVRVGVGRGSVPAHRGRAVDSAAGGADVAGAGPRGVRPRRAGVVSELGRQLVGRAGP